jgi:hypothetical protein
MKIIRLIGWQEVTSRKMCVAPPEVAEMEGLPRTDLEKPDLAIET